jgi:putative FmdB family regulatory protein
MPVYEYRCAACGHSFSRLFRSMSSVVAADCPQCGRPNAERALSRFAYHQSMQMKIESLDPKYEKELDWADRQQRADDPLSRVNLDFSGPSRDD